MLTHTPPPLATSQSDCVPRTCTQECGQQVTKDGSHTRNRGQQHLCGCCSSSTPVCSKGVEPNQPLDTHTDMQKASRARLPRACPRHTHCCSDPLTQPQTNQTNAVGVPSACVFCCWPADHPDTRWKRNQVCCCCCCSSTCSAGVRLCLVATPQQTQSWHVCLRWLERLMHTLHTATAGVHSGHTRRVPHDNCCLPATVDTPTVLLQLTHTPDPAAPGRRPGCCNWRTHTPILLLLAQSFNAQTT